MCLPVCPSRVPPTAVPSSSGLRRPSASPPPVAKATTFAPSCQRSEERDERPESELGQPLIETISSKVGPGGPAASQTGSRCAANGRQDRPTQSSGPGPKAYQHHRPSCAPPACEADSHMKKLREARRKEIRRELEKWDTVTGTGEKSGCNMSFVFDPSGRLCYYWSVIVSLAFLYNFWVIMYRFAFEEINQLTMSTWLTLDGVCDFIYILDIAVHFRTGYLDEGVLQTETSKLRTHYMNSTMFYIDCLCLLPLDFLYLSIGFNSMLRCFRLVKIYRFWSFLDRTERHTNYPNVFRTISLSHYILVIFHWNACLYHLISTRGGFGSADWFTGSRVEECSDVDCDYLHAFYWSTLALTTIGDLPRPRTKAEYLFLIIELVSGLLMLATVLGHVANIVTNVSAARKEFQAKLKAEIAIHVHLDTLKRVEIFQNTEAGFLCALVLRLRPVLFSPGDYVCRKGEVGKEMYIVNRGRLQVVTDNGKTVLATLRAGSYFGEISILNMGTAGNRRTASVKSVGYSDLFCLSKTDMWDVLKDYPAARVRLEAIAVKRLEKYRKEPLKKIAMSRSRSTPGLVESPLPGQNMIMGHGVHHGHRKETATSASAGTLLTEDKMIIHCEADTPGGADSESSKGSMHEGSGPHGHCQPMIQGYLPVHPSFGLTPATPTMQVAPSMPAQYFVTLPVPGGSPWYERRTSQPQTPLEAMMVPMSGGGPLPMPGSPSRASSFYALSPAHSAPHLAEALLAQQQTQMAPPLGNTLQPPGGSRTPTPSLPAATSETSDLLVSEIKRLRERLQSLESENATMSIKLNRQQWDVESRLAEIEMHMSSSAERTTDHKEQCPTPGQVVPDDHATGAPCGPPCEPVNTSHDDQQLTNTLSSASDDFDDSERNKESTI
ncbi:Cyclic nucleotide-gated cation channel alpha-3 [Halotydeus destructor]|nr:Cyclic nucleotide-gated cation channel alpha-3 [Halotydeus destructor]